MIGTISRRRKIGYTIYDSKVNGSKFDAHLRKMTKLTKSKYYYLDNASIHRCGTVYKTIAEKDIIPIWGIPYTPELNIIENFWRSFKSKLRDTLLSSRTNIAKLIGECWDSVLNSI